MREDSPAEYVRSLTASSRQGHTESLRGKGRVSEPGETNGAYRHCRYAPFSTTRKGQRALVNLAASGPATAEPPPPPSTTTAKATSPL